MADSNTAETTATDAGTTETTAGETPPDGGTADVLKGKRITGGDRTSMADDLRQRYDGGESIRSLASSTNRSYGFVHRLLSESGANLRSRGGANRNSSTKA